MSQNRRSNSDTTAEDMVGCVLMLMWAVTGGVIALAWNWIKVQPEILLQEIGTPSVWGKQIQTVACPHCAVANEQGQIVCFACSGSLPSPTATRQRIVKLGPFYQERLFLMGLLLFAMIVFTFCYVAATAGI